MLIVKGFFKIEVRHTFGKKKSVLLIFFFAKKCVTIYRIICYHQSSNYFRKSGKKIF
jgi:hypothetical protein